MKQNLQLAIAVAALSLAVLIATLPAWADGPSNPSAADSAVSAGSESSGQVLEIPPTYAPTPDAASGSGGNSATSPDTWSDGSSTYTWKDETPDSSQAAQDPDAPNPQYAGVDQYLNQEAEAEAMGPGLSPMFSPVFGAPLVLDPFMMYGSYPLQFYSTPSYVPPPPPPHISRWMPPRPPMVGGPPLGGHWHHFRPR